MAHKTSEIRSAFLDYFAANGHEIVASSPLVPHNDPTLLFTNAGMVQFKNVFTGLETRSCNRAVTSQKCVRAGGKHNDLENVGYTARHHTFFEMLGNFSFGDYFKDLAIELAWNLVTRELGLAAERLLVTVYAEDDEAFELWRKIAGLPEQRIIRIGTSDNFWSMGETGPCGPCSEIFYDHGEGIPGGPPGSPDEDGDRFIEIWNLVFMQFEQVDADTRNDLPRPSIDTGMGLERVAAVMQGKHDNYDIDLMQALVSASAAASGVAPDGEHAVGHRVIVLARSNVGFIWVNKQSEVSEGGWGDYNRAGGLDFSFSPSTAVNIQAFYARTWDKEREDAEDARYLRVAYSGTKYSGSATVLDVAADLSRRRGLSIAGVGFGDFVATMPICPICRVPKSPISAI